MATYDSNVPVEGNSITSSQPDIQGNFQALYDAFLKNHVSIDAATLTGKHTIVELLEVATGQANDQGEISLYTKDVEGQTDQLFLKMQGGQEVQFSNYQIYSINDDSHSHYFTFLPGKIIVYFGTFNSRKNTVVTVNLYPQVAKHIITLAFCAADYTNRMVPIQLIQNDKGFYSAFTTDPYAITSTLNLKFDYFVLANL